MKLLIIETRKETLGKKGFGQIMEEPGEQGEISPLTVSAT